MKKFTKILESNKPDLEDLETYFDSIKDSDFNIKIKDCYVRRPTADRTSTRVESDYKKIPTSDISNWKRGVIINIWKSLRNRDVSFDGEFGMGHITSPQSFDLGVDDLNQFFYDILGIIAYLKSYNPTLGIISSGNWFIVIDYEDLTQEEISSGEEYQKAINWIVTKLNEWFSQNRYSRDNPNGLRSLIGVRSDRSNNGVGIDFWDSRSNGYQKIQSIIAHLTGTLQTRQRVIPEIIEIKDQVEKLGWVINRIGGSSKINIEKKK